VADLVVDHNPHSSSVAAVADMQPVEFGVQPVAVARQVAEPPLVADDTEPVAAGPVAIAAAAVASCGPSASVAVVVRPWDQVAVAVPPEPVAVAIDSRHEDAEQFG